ncbi:hypothetical protein VCJ71_07305 [Alteriqipengyuania sp. WL0013]|uniref:hypothetical protein n=1 Tax=Alteriqipengyuania sp. WL0013 TaxID=3110773 RepID=UPI002C0C478E|nr:hypothetical protein [Alteriqipengyuania sp. WL0013]MEB3415870.1 hypothetical protein [Alteriqipengyuania sp. WL0013]
MTDVGGKYDCVTKSPMGDQTSTLTVIPGDDGKTFTGTNKGQMGELEIKDGTIDGNTLTWKMDMVVPMPMTLNATATVDGDQLNGTVNAGAFGDMAMTGTRVN